MFKNLTVVLLQTILLFFSFMAWSCTAVKPPSEVMNYPAASPDSSKVFTADEIHKDDNTTELSKQDNQGPIEVGIEETVLMAMQNNQGLVVEKMNPLIQKTFEEQEQSVFDPVFGAGLSNKRSVAERLSRAGSATESSTVDTMDGSAYIDKLFPTGTNLSLLGSTNIVDSSLYSDKLASTRLGLTVTQAILQGADIKANTASIQQAWIDTRISEYELRGFAELLLEAVESAYWNLAMAERRIEIYNDSLTLAEKQMSEVQERIKIGKLAETELAAAQAEVALRRENLINARSDLAKAQLVFLQILNPGGNNMWDRKIVLKNQPMAPDVELDKIEEHVKVAMIKRADLNQARREVEKGELEVIKTKNGILPKLDFFITFGKTGYSGVFNESVKNVGGDSYDVVGGLALEYPPLNRQARALHHRAVLTKQQAIEAVHNLTQIVEVDVRSAYIEVNRAKEQISATAATRKLQEEKLRAENEKFRVGKSTSLLVAQAQRDLVASQITEIEAVVTYLKALVNLHRMEGSLLDRRGINTPGNRQ
ncbi:MAG: TolC family protein [Candidatus Brocadiia bacterium]|nr:MAG: TolC family protein [Candidatus Brocadiia bacterium]